MAWIVQLLFPRRRRNRHELARRAAEVVSRVLTDIGIDRFLNGTMLVDQQLRVRFVSCGVAIGSVHAAVRADTLVQARCCAPATAAWRWRRRRFSSRSRAWSRS